MVIEGDVSYDIQFTILQIESSCYGGCSTTGGGGQASTGEVTTTGSTTGDTCPPIVAVSVNGHLNTLTSPTIKQTFTATINGTILLLEV